jgi:hypothetical protein
MSLKEQGQHDFKLFKGLVQRVILSKYEDNSLITTLQSILARIREN